jgi:DNA-binding NarL/FixJ family response regulator
MDTGKKPLKPARAATPSVTGALRIAVVDDDESTHASVRAALTELRPKWRVDSYLSGEASLEGLAERRPHVVLMDIRMPGMSGLDCTRRIKARFPQLPVVMHTARADAVAVLLAVLAGADGYLAKPVSPEVMVGAVEDALADTRPPLCPEAGRGLVKFFHRCGESARLPEALTVRELEILACCLLEPDYKGIAERLGISPRTVSAHLQTIFRKLGVHSRAEAARRLLGLG